ncbi:putative fluoride ion transporter CrcB [Devosia pacifica]|uniref:Fluoride-specific ion channel FluC n=1 Tax=Devosia pacifica TaxID=1335967 RepID=A0A918RUP0_9HYPH|nr:fluoride efflux transporter CrcB [Devosia pacifica]GHA12727.1 putative fluoride ion transporter CrcB [Devosia pacifica]
MQNFLLVGAGGAIGAIGRYGLSVLFGRLLPTGFPAATLVANILGSIAMGLFIGWLARSTPSWQAELRLFVAIGLLGGFTTFSSFSLDTVALLERGAYGQALAYILASVVISVFGLFVGLSLIRSLPL